MGNRRLLKNPENRKIREFNFLFSGGKRGFILSPHFFNSLISPIRNGGATVRERDERAFSKRMKETNNVGRLSAASGDVPGPKPATEIPAGIG